MDFQPMREEETKAGYKEQETAFAVIIQNSISQPVGL